MAAFLLDVPLSIERGLVAVSDVGAPLDELHRGGRHKSVFTYVHDKWQLRPNITVDLGLRHEYYTPVVGFHGRGGMVNYDPETNTLLVAGYGDIPENLGVKGYWLNFNPRTGISWRVNDSNVLRAGYGVSAEGGPSQTRAGLPDHTVPDIDGPNAFAPAGSLATGIPAPSFAADSGERHPAGGRTAAQRRASAVFCSSRITMGSCTRGTWPTSGHCLALLRPRWPTSATGQRTTGAAKISMRATSLGADRAGQPLFVKYGRTASTTVQVRDGRPDSKYHSMQIKVDRRMRDGLMMTNSYTLGRAWDYNNGTPAHPNRFERGVGRTAFDTLHNFTSSFAYMLPWGPQGSWLREGALGKVFGDWQITGLFSAASGTPIDFSASAAGLRARTIPRRRT